MRYAVYFTPEPSHPLTVAAQAWLGRDAFTGEAIPARDHEKLKAADVRRHTAEPRRYGFHATLVAPFQLAADVTEDDLIQSAINFVRGRVPFSIRLATARIGSFHALAPAAPSVLLDTLAESAVDHFNGLRAPLGEAEIRRRSLGGLSMRQETYLLRYGYPYVRDEFRFHMTLTGAMPDPAPEWELALEAYFAPLIAVPILVDAITLFVEPERGAPLNVLSMHRFRIGEARKSA